MTSDAPGLVLRPATRDDAEGMSRVLAAILAAKRSDRPSDPAHVLEHYIAHPDRVACTVAVENGHVVGFQSLRRARAGNPYGVTPGWGIIGTYVEAGHEGRGIGRGLFQASLSAAGAAGLPAIDATIGRANAGGQAYYGAIGFRDYAETATALRKRYDL